MDARSGEFDKNLVAFPLHRKDFLLHAGSQRGLACHHIKLPTMPWAGHAGSIKRTFRKWSALVRANPINRLIFFADLKYGNHTPLMLDFPSFGRTDFRYIGNTDPFSHEFLNPLS